MKIDRFNDIITYKPDEVELLSKFARKRFDNHRKIGTKDKTQGVEKFYRNEIVGILTEFAVSKYLKLTFNFESKGSDHGIDHIFAGSTINTKGTTYPNGKLRVNNTDDLKADFYFLAIWDQQLTVTLKGYASRQTYLDNGYYDDFGHKNNRPAFVLEQRFLKSISKSWEFDYIPF